MRQTAQQKEEMLKRKVQEDVCQGGSFTSANADCQRPLEEDTNATMGVLPETTRSKCGEISGSKCDNIWQAGSA